MPVTHGSCRCSPPPSQVPSSRLLPLPVRQSIYISVRDLHRCLNDLANVDGYQKVDIQTGRLVMVIRTQRSGTLTTKRGGLCILAPPVAALGCSLQRRLLSRLGRSASMRLSHVYQSEILRPNMYTSTTSLIETAAGGDGIRGIQHYMTILPSSGSVIQIMTLCKGRSWARRSQEAAMAY